jgi:hypothetical protein
MGGPRNRAAEKKAAGVPWRPPWVALARTKTETGVRFKSNGARVPWKRSTKISRLHELIRRGGATKLANVNGCPIIAAAAQRTTECLAKGGKAAKSYPQKELALQEWECWLLYMSAAPVRRAHARLEELDRLLFHSAEGDPAVADYKYEPVDKETIIAYMHMVTAHATQQWEVGNPKFAGHKKAGAYTRSLFSSSRGVSDTQKHPTHLEHPRTLRATQHPRAPPIP